MFSIIFELSYHGLQFLLMFHSCKYYFHLCIPLWDINLAPKDQAFYGMHPEFLKYA